MDTATKHPVPDRVKPSFVILTSGHSDAQGWASECPDVKNYKWRLYPVWHRMLYSCTHMATVGVKGLMCIGLCLFMVPRTHRLLHSESKLHLLSSCSWQLVSYFWCCSSDAVLLCSFYSSWFSPSAVKWSHM